MKKQKLALLFGLAATAFTLTGCDALIDFINDNTPGGETTPITPPPTPSNPDTDLGPAVTEATQITPKHTYKDIGNNNVYTIDYCPTTGSPKLLIIPVWFSDSSTFIASGSKDAVRNDIQKAYLGSNDETGWRSVKTFYEEESNNKVTLNGVVTDWYEVSKSYSYYGTENEYQTKTPSLVNSAVNWYFENHSSDSRTNYDSDGNGWLDGVMLIYAAPNYMSLSNDYDNLWAYCYWVQEDNASKLNPQPNVYFWASYDFMYSNGSDAMARTGKSSFGYGDTSHCSVDAHTYIHEMGHVFGLDDYYNYNHERNEICPSGGFSMQDYNVGGHDPFSVFAFGWASPYVISGSDEIIIGTFQKTRDLILITPRWNSYDSPFDEYILLELYSPTGLNEFDCSYVYSGYGEYGPTATGIRMWHVDARLVNCYETDYQGYPVYSASDITNNPDPAAKGAIDSYGVITAFTNSPGSDDYGSVLGRQYDKYRLLQLIRNNTRATYNSKDTISNDDLFGIKESSYDLSSFSSQFANGTKLDNGSSINYSLNITISGNGSDAQAKVVITQK